MNIKILLNKSLSIKERVKRFVSYNLLRRGTRILWNKRFKKVFEIHPDYRNPVEKSIEKAHISYWKVFQRRINMATLRVCKNISGIADPRFIPEEIFANDIEPTLNEISSVDYLEVKSFYNRWFPGKGFPIDYFHNINGDWLDPNLETITFDDIKSIATKLNYPVVFKPNRDSYGGKNIYFPENFEELLKLIENKTNYVVQEKIKQHSFFEQFNYHSINTLRVYVYRSVTDNRHHVINIVLRMGVGGSLDNETAGGILAMVNKEGSLNGFAVDKYGKKYISHPDTGVKFDQKIPDLEKLKFLSLEVSKKVFYARLIGLDLCYDQEGNWRMIEVNINGAAIRLAQYHGALFFGEYTDEVYDYCIRNHWLFK
jgi:Sugar-transfer associated ATP-grasp